MTRGSPAGGPLIIVYTDGASRGNPGPASAGVVVFDHGGRKLREFGKSLGVATNNEAEYRAAIEGLAAARDFTAGRIELRSDSELLVKQANKEYRVKAPRLVALQSELTKAAAAFTRVDFRHVPRSHPGAQRADLLADRALDLAEKAAGRPARS